MKLKEVEVLRFCYVNAKAQDALLIVKQIACSKDMFEQHFAQQESLAVENLPVKETPIDNRSWILTLLTKMEKAMIEHPICGHYVWIADTLLEFSMMKPCEVANKQTMEHIVKSIDSYMAQLEMQKATGKVIGIGDMRICESSHLNRAWKSTRWNNW